MYTWAGQYRKVNISKQGNAFMALQAFDTGETYMDALIKKFHDRSVLKRRNHPAYWQIFWII
jgi:cell filamentation protein